MGVSIEFRLILCLNLTGEVCLLTGELHVDSLLFCVFFLSVSKACNQKNEIKFNYRKRGEKLLKIVVSDNDILSRVRAYTNFKCQCQILQLSIVK